MATSRTGMRAALVLLETTDIMERIEETEMAAITIAMIGTTIMEDRGVIIEAVLKMTDEICPNQWANFRLKVSLTFSLACLNLLIIISLCRKGRWSPKT